MNYTERDIYVSTLNSEEYTEQMWQRNRKTERPIGNIQQITKTETDIQRDRHIDPYKQTRRTDTQTDRDGYLIKV